MKRVGRDFFARDTLIVARELLGKVLCVQISGENAELSDMGRCGQQASRKGIIVEAEAYTQDDPACHGYKGCTERSKPIFQKPGIAYVYLIYGMHYCMNFSTDREGYGSAVLIRALEPLGKFGETNGPAKLCKALRIKKEFNGCDTVSENSPIWLEYGEKIDPKNIVQTTRIGITKATDYNWRFYVANNKWVSKK